MSFDLVTALGTVAPTLAGMLGGPLAGTAVSALATAFGLSPGAGQDAITKVVQEGNMTPDIIAKVREQDQKHAETLKQLDIDLDRLNKAHEEALTKLVVDDRMSARDSNVKGGVQGKLFWLSVIILVLSLGTEMTVLFHGYPKEVPELVVGRVLGMVDSVALMVLAYWYGSSPSAAAAVGGK